MYDDLSEPHDTSTNNMARLISNVFISALLISGFCCGFVSAEHSVFHRFLKFIDDFNRKYENGTREFERRFENFKASLQRAERLNEAYTAQGHSAVYGVTKFSDFSQEEFTAQYLEDLRPSQTLENFSLQFLSEASLGRNGSALHDPPKKVDWREAGVVSPIKNQGQCGACWAFAATEAVESAYAIAHNTSAPQLAVQQVIDCSAKNFGCRGGDTCAALTYIKKSGITYEVNYPLTDRDGTCRSLSPSDKMVKIASSTCTREEAILEQLATIGPVTAAVDASTWNNYIGGIIQFHCSANINHAVDIVGYDLTGPVPYYIVRNSWGTDFGLEGYIYIKVGSNLCGIAEEISDVRAV